MNVKNFFAVLAAAAAGYFTQVSAATLTFEDLDPSPATYDAMPVYNGFTFSGWLYGPDTVYPTASGTIDLFTDFANPNDPYAWIITKNNIISSTQPFYFDGAWFAGSSGVTFELSLNEILVATSTTLLDAIGNVPYGPTFLASGYAGLTDKIVVSGVQGFFAMDDFTYRTAAVPEPGTHLMVLLCLVGVGAVAQMRKRQSGQYKRARSIS